MSEITTHILDVSTGRPAAGVPVILEIAKTGGGWTELGRGTTDGDGRLRNLIAPGSLAEGTYRLTFETQAYFDARKIATLYPQVCVVFRVRDAKQDYHIPLLLSPYGYSTYRGS
jgi:5-hydroxyisourate hydrolase